MCFENTAVRKGTHHSCLCGEHKLEEDVSVQKQAAGPGTVLPKWSDVAD